MKPAAAKYPAARVLVVAQSAERRMELLARVAEEQQTEPAAIPVAELSPALQRASAGAVVVMDVDSDQTSAALLAAQLGAVVVLLADDPEPGWATQVLAAGVRAILPRDCSWRQIAAGVQAAAAGLAAMDSSTLRGLLTPPPESIELEPGEEELTARESEVLRMLTEGLSNREIASLLGISEHTVKFHITSIFGKLGTSSRTEAATEGIRRGLVIL